MLEIDYCTLRKQELADAEDQVKKAGEKMGQNKD
jgi:hypothetical protein